VRVQLQLLQNRLQDCWLLLLLLLVVKGPGTAALRIEGTVPAEAWHDTYSRLACCSMWKGSTRTLLVSEVQGSGALAASRAAESIAKGALMSSGLLSSSVCSVVVSVRQHCLRCIAGRWVWCIESLKQLAQRCALRSFLHAVRFDVVGSWG
jgi:hypothetical protein